MAQPNGNEVRVVPLLVSVSVDLVFPKAFLGFCDLGSIIRNWCEAGTIATSMAAQSC